MDSWDGAPPLLDMQWHCPPMGAGCTIVITSPRFIVIITISPVRPVWNCFMIFAILCDWLPGFWTILFFSNLPSYILIVFAGLLWLCHLVWLHLLVKAAAVPYIRTQRAAFEIQRSAWAAVNWALSMGSQCVQQSLTLLRLLAEQPRWIYKATVRKCLFEYCMLVEAFKLQNWTI